MEVYPTEERRRPGAFFWVIGGLLALLVVGTLVVPLVLGWYYGFSFTYPRPYFLFFPFGFVIFIFLAFFAFRFLFWGWGWNRGYYGNRWWYSDPRDIVRRRYARGEITKEQFEQMMRDLDSHPSAAS